MPSRLCLAFALVLAACGNADPASPRAAAAEVERPSPAAPISDNPHPAEMATHCLRVVGAMITGPQAERCKSEHLWATASEKKAPLSDACLLHRITLTARSVAIDMALIPRSSPYLPSAMLSLNECQVAGQFILLSPFDYPDKTDDQDRLTFISFALRTIGEDRRWSPPGNSADTTVWSLCQAFEVSTDETIKQQAREALGCDW